MTKLPYCWKSHDACWKSHDACWKSHDACWKSHDACWKSHDTAQMIVSCMKMDPKACAERKDLDQPAHLCNLIRVFLYHINSRTAMVQTGWDHEN